MYLARQLQKDGEIKYLIRYSYQDKSNIWLSKNLFNLGNDPEKYIIYVGDRAFYIDPIIEETISSQGIIYNYDELEKLFLPFLDPEVRRIIEQFDRPRDKRQRYSKKELAEMQKGLHPFDRRRLCFMKFCDTNIENLSKQPFSFFNILLNKSRDEIENILGSMESMLNPREKRGYLYAIFNLPQRFAPRLTRFIPEAQHLELIDKYILEEICKLDKDHSFLDQGAIPYEVNGLHPYLRKYLIQYFDILYKWTTTRSYTRYSGTKNKAWSPPAKFLDEKYLKTMGISADKYLRMDKKEFSLLFKRRAHKLHPDKGGKHETFIELLEAYQILLSKKT
jgi:hypothetical protein